MAEQLSGVNGNIIRWAREFYNMSPEEAARSIGVSTEKYSAWESGAEFPTYAKLKKISDVFRKPSAVFFFSEPPNIPPIKGDLRTLPDTVVDGFSKNVMIQLEKAKAYQLNLMELYETSNCIFTNRAIIPTETKQLCNFLRNIMVFPLSAQKGRKNTKVVFEIYREKFYELGIYVFKDSFKDNNVSGLCINDDLFPVILINNSMSFARQIFTLFHEFYHLVSNTSGAEIIRDDYYKYLDGSQSVTEKNCDTFANEFLVPTDDFKIELSKKDIDDHRIAELSTLYSVSKEAIMYKLWTLKIITPKEYESLKETFYGDAIRNQKKKNGENSSGGNYYFTKLAYLGSSYTGDVFKQLYSGKIDSFRASEMLNSKVDHLPQLEAAYFRGNK
ncbi:MAG: ImmA/IrrE family metallo-endopeptidase [Ruminococcus bromii]|nr:ImmA/IrrE family metallo-endopeptidase [Ruminococcus bromii]